MAQLGLAPTLSGTTARLVAIGDLTGRTVTGVEQAVSELLDEGVTTLTVDLRRVGFVEREAVETLVAVSARACERGVSVRLCADPAIRDRLEAAKAMALFAAIDEALATAHSTGTLLEVRPLDTAAPTEVEAVTWISTDEPPVPTS